MNPLSVPLALVVLGVVCCAPTTAYTPAAEKDRVVQLPGWNGTLPSNHFSGYIPVGTTSGVKGHIHYYYIESENDPATSLRD